MRPVLFGGADGKEQDVSERLLHLWPGEFLEPNGWTLGRGREAIKPRRSHCLLLPECGERNLVKARIFLNLPGTNGLVVFFPLRAFVGDELLFQFGSEDLLDEGIRFKGVNRFCQCLWQ